MSTTQAYVPVYNAESRFLTVRGLKHHMLVWGDLSRVTPEQPLLVLVHGWMDTSHSFQFMVDALRQRPGWADRPIVALDWRGFGLTEFPRTDNYFFADYLGDLDLLLDEIAPGQRIDLLGHSMGGNVVMIYAGLRSDRIRKLINLEGFGMPATQPQEAPERYLKWLEELKKPMQLKDYNSLKGVANRLRMNNARLREPFALWLAQHWAHQVGERWVINADPAHKRSQPILYRVEEVGCFLQRIQCPVLFVEGADTLYFMLFNGRYSRDEFLTRVKVVPDFRLESIADAGHMLHHDQPEELAAHIADFLQPADASAA